MPSVAAQLKDLRQKVEALQVEVAGRQHITSMVIWDEHNQSSVNQKSSRLQEDFSGLVVHLTPELSSSSRTVKDDGLSQNEFIELKEAIARSLDQSAGSDVTGAD